MNGCQVNVYLEPVVYRFFNFQDSTASDFFLRLLNNSVPRTCHKCETLNEKFILKRWDADIGKDELVNAAFAVLAFNFRF